MVDIDLPSPISAIHSIATPPEISSPEFYSLVPPTLSPFLDEDDCLNISKSSVAYDPAKHLEKLKKIGFNNKANDEARLRFSPKQCFGSSNQAEIVDADMLSTVQFDDRGEYLGTGDRGGRVVIFKRNSGKGSKSNGKVSKSSEYKFYAEFLSHEPGFDYLKSLEVEERINQVKWLPGRSRNALFLLSTNDKTVKLWKLRESGTSLVPMVVNTQQMSSGTVDPINRHSKRNYPASYERSQCRMNGEIKGTPRLELPRIRRGKSYVVASPSRIFANAYVYHINSTDPSCDGEHFLASDEFGINIQNYNVTECLFNVVDIKSGMMDEITEVITSSIFLPNHSNIFLYSTSKGIIRVCDLRQSTKCGSEAVALKDANGMDAMSCSASEATCSISDIQSTQDGRYIASRDYMTVKLWDTHMSKKPFRTFGVHNHLKDKLIRLHRNGYTFDKFNVEFNGAGSHVLTGSYNNTCHIYSFNTDAHSTIQLCKQPTRRKTGERKPIGTLSGRGDMMEQRVTSTHNICFDKKITHASWHPGEDTLAMGAQNKLFFYCGKRK